MLVWDKKFVKNKPKPTPQNKKTFNIKNMTYNETGTETQLNKALPEKPTLEGIENKWKTHWEKNKTYAFNSETSKEKVYSIDTPPPTASGSLHVGHIFSYTQTDVIARYKRMCGKTVFYPMGWDDNGLPTERRVQNYFGVRCDPKLPYIKNFTPPTKTAEKEKDFIKISRKNFIELCQQLTILDEKIFQDLFTTLGLSVDWQLSYRTIDKNASKTSQQAFLENIKMGNAYCAKAPTLWDVTFQTAVAQAELEDRQRPGAYHTLAFPKSDNTTSIHIETTRPELLPACVALVANPNDQRYQKHFGHTVRTPIFNVEVPILAHPLAQIDKGSGIAMVCTFGDLTDVTWWRELQLPTRPIIGNDGRILPEIPNWITEQKAREKYCEISGKTTFSARETIVKLLISENLLRDKPKPITHAVNFYEKGEKPLEIITTRQWYIKNGGRNEKLREELLNFGKQLIWHPEFMAHRYNNWVSGLNGDWLVSRQRFFGVPIPLWYQLDENKKPDYDNPILPKITDLPVDPATDTAPNFDQSQRNQPGGFSADPDVLDTWATSSLTPQIVGGWERNPKLFSLVFPFDLRPQGHDIIRTWLFSTIVQANSLHKQLPWKNAALSGWILDPDRKKMSKSKGNVVVPTDILSQFGSDAVRYWAASAKLGADTAYDTGQMKIGRRLAIKLLNASKFILNLGVETKHITKDITKISNPIDQALLKKLDNVISIATTALEKYDYAKALQTSETFFWFFTDDYLELTKNRAYGNEVTNLEQNSVLQTLATSLDKILRIFAPFLPFVTEEIWSWWHTESSIHQTVWPESTILSSNDLETSTKILANINLVLGQIRKAKSEAKMKQRTEVLEATILANQKNIDTIKLGIKDIQAAGNIKNLKFCVNSSTEILVQNISLQI